MGGYFEGDSKGSNFEEIVDYFVSMGFVHLLLALRGVGEEHDGWVKIIFMVKEEWVNMIDKLNIKVKLKMATTRLE